MKTAVMTELTFEDSENVTIDRLGSEHKVRVVRHTHGSDTATVYAARISKNGRVNSNAVPMLQVSIYNLPEVIYQGLMKALEA